MNPIFIDKENLTRGLGLVGKIKTSEIVVDRSVRGESLAVLHQRVKEELIRQADLQFGNDRQLYFVVTRYDIKDDGRVGIAYCEVYR